MKKPSKYGWDRDSEGRLLSKSQQQDKLGRQLRPLYPVIWVLIIFFTASELGLFVIFLALILIIIFFFIDGYLVMDKYGSGGDTYYDE